MAFNMNLQLDPTSGVPLYIQLKDKLRYTIITGGYKAGSKLPTVRQLAVTLKINPNTVSRVYSELEREGLLATRQGRGTFICNLPDPQPERAGELERLLAEVLARAHELGFTAAEVKLKLAEMLNENGGG